MPETSAYLIFDDALAKRAKQLEFYTKQGVVVEAETIEALAKKIEVPENILKETIDMWNMAVKDKKNEDFGIETAMDYDLTEKPYYAIKIAPGIYHTMGGVKINTETQVIGKGDKAIPGLYAAGGVTGGLHGNK